MNEKLTVRNFGPITDAEVEFKRVTVFIGPTGGGKSTLAKLAAIFRDSDSFLLEKTQVEKSGNFLKRISHYDLFGHIESTSLIKWGAAIESSFVGGYHTIIYGQSQIEEVPKNFTIGRLREDSMRDDELDEMFPDEPRYVDEEYTRLLIGDNEEIDALRKFRKLNLPVRYTPAERNFAATFSESLASLALIDTPLPHTLLEFINRFAIARKQISLFSMPFFT